MTKTNLNMLLRRRQLELTQAQVAERCGIGTIRLHRIEKSGQIPDLELARRIARALETDVDRLWPESDKTAVTASSQS